MSPARTRTVRLSALALATGTLVATAATGAFAATGSGSAPTSYQGATTSNAISLQLFKNSPALPVAIPGVDTSKGLSVDLLNGTSTLVHDGTGSKPDSADSTIALIGGTLGAAAAMGGSSNPIPTASSSLKNPGPNKASGPGGAPTSNMLGPLGTITAPDFSAMSTKSPLTTGTTATGLDLSTLTLKGIVPAAVLSQFTTGYQMLITQVGTLQTAIAALGNAGSAIPIPTGTTNPFTALSTALTTIQTEAQAAYTQITTGTLVDVNGLVSDSSIKTVGSQEVSTAHVELGSLKLLGGFASVTGFNNTVTAKAGGTPGSATFTPDVTNGGLGALTVAGVGGSLSGSGLTTTGLDAVLGALPGASAFTTGLDTVISTLQSGLAQLNAGLMGLVTITADTPSNVTVAKDGTSASGQLDGLGLAINLPNNSGLPALPTLPAPPSGLSAIPGLSTAIGALSGLSGKSAHSSRAATAAAAAPAPPVTVLGLSVGSAAAAAGALVQSPAVAGQSNGTNPTGALAFTGADLPLTAGIATLLIAGSVGLVIRRRRTHEEI